MIMTCQYHENLFKEERKLSSHLIQKYDRCMDILIPCPEKNEGNLDILYI